MSSSALTPVKGYNYSSTTTTVVYDPKDNKAGDAYNYNKDRTRNVYLCKESNENLPPALLAQSLRLQTKQAINSAKTCYTVIRSCSLNVTLFYSKLTSREIENIRKEFTTSLDQLVEYVTRAPNNEAFSGMDKYVTGATTAKAIFDKIYIKVHVREHVMHEPTNIVFSYLE